jgi:hypothetical protein
LAAVPTLPRGAELHLLSHSRGGLIGEVLSHCATDELELRLDSYDAEHVDCTALRELLDVLRDRGITVTRFARVVCPARGTTLASRRLDRWASFLFNVFHAVPAMRERPERPHWSRSSCWPCSISEPTRGSFPVSRRRCHSRPSCGCCMPRRR